MGAQRGGQVLAEAPPMRCAVVIDDADLVVPETVDAVLVEEEPRVVNQKVAHLRFSKVEHQPTRMSLVCEVQRVAVPAVRRLPVEEIEAFVAEVSSRVVVDKIEHDG